MFGRGWHGGEGGGRGRMFEKGDLKYVVLDLLQEKPRHGYEIIRALEDRFGGWYTPSPGAVYPTLQLLDDLGYVTVAEQDGKKIYRITEAGRVFLNDREHVMEDIRGRFRGWWEGDRARPSGDHRAAWAEMKDEMGAFAQLFRRYGRDAISDPDKVRRLRAVLAAARAEIETILKEPPRERDSASSASGPVTQ